MGGERRQYQPSRGTKGFWRVFASVVRPGRDAGLAPDAFRPGSEQRFRVSCFLRGQMAPYPRRLRQGSLFLGEQEPFWTPFWSIRRGKIVINEQILSVDVREAGSGPGEWNLKKGGTAYGGLVQIPRFVIVACKTPRGLLELAVTDTDVALVRSGLTRLRQHQRP